MNMCRCLGCMQQFDNSKTSICPHCGYDQNAGKKEAYHLDPGTVLEGRYIIGRALGSGGFGITYMAWDSVLENRVAIKEYFPSEFATRLSQSTEVCAYDGEKTYQYEAGLTGFVDEALRLVSLNHLDGIVHVFDSFIANNTAYIIMEYLEGETVKDMLKSRGPIPYNEVIEIVLPVLDSLEEVHKSGIIHRDIAPDNIIKTVDGKIKLLDFGAARNATTVHSKSLSIILKPGYAPEEQYRSHGEQGPWTDVYAMAAVMYHMITGKLPTESVERKIKDDLKTPTELGFVLPVPVENAIMNALNVRAEYRTHSAKAFAEELSGAVEVERVIDKTKDKNDIRLSKKAKIAISVAAAAAAALIALIVLTTTSITSFTVQRDTFPNLMGANEDQVVSLLENVGLDDENYIITGREKLDGYDAGTIVYQSIDPGVKFNTSDVVELKMAEEEIEKEDVSSDTATVPQLLAMTKSEAKSALRKSGFKNYAFKTKKNNSYESGLVCGQSVKASKTVDKSKKIVVYIAKNSQSKATEETTEATTQRITSKTSSSKAATKATTRATQPTTRATTKPTTQATTKSSKTSKSKTSSTVTYITIPDVAGMSKSSGVTTLESKGLSVHISYEDTNDESLDGICKSTSPAAGKKVTNTQVTLYVYQY